MIAASKKLVLPTVSINTDYSRGARYIFKWSGFNKELFQALKLAGVQSEKIEGQWTIWAPPEKFATCLKALESLDVNLVSNLDLNEERNKSLSVTPEPYTIVKIGTVYATVHFEYNRPMLEALKLIPANGRIYDEYTHDWQIKHEYITLLINSWRSLDIPVQSLENVQRIVG